MPLGSNHHRLIEVDKVSLKMVVLTNLLNNDDHFASLRFVKNDRCHLNRIVRVGSYKHSYSIWNLPYTSYQMMKVKLAVVSFWFCYLYRHFPFLIDVLKNHINQNEIFSFGISKCKKGCSIVHNWVCRFTLVVFSADMTGFLSD